MGLLSDIGDFFFGWLVPDVPEPPLTGTQLRKSSTDNYLPKIIGEVKKQEGIIIFKKTNDTDNDDRRNDLLHIIIVWGYSVRSIDEVYLDDIPASSNNEAFFYEGSRIAFVRNFPDGMSNYEFSELTLAGWDESDKLRGCACSYVRIEYIAGEKTLKSEPTIKADLTGTATNNPMDALSSYLQNPIYGKGESADNINLDRLLLEKAYCFDQVETVEGSNEFRQRFTFNGALDGSSTVLENVNKILKSCRAYLPILNGKLTPIIERDVAPVSLEITDKDILKISDIKDSNKSNRYNRLVVQYIDDTANSTQQDAIYPPPGSQLESDWLAEDNGVLLEKREKLESCRNFHEALAHAKALAEISRRQLNTKITIGLWGVLFQVGDVVNISHPYPGWDRKAFRITRTNLRSDTVELYVREHRAGAYSVPGNQTSPNFPDPTPPGGTTPVIPGDVDQTANLTKSLNALINSGGGVLNLKRGDYIISNTLPIASNITIRGQGMPSYHTKWFEIFDASIDEGKILLTLIGADVDEWVNHRLMSGDVVKIDGLTNGNGVQEIDKVFPDSNQIRLMKNADIVGIEDRARIRLSVLKGGTIIRFHNHNTGESTTGLRFFDESDVRNFCLYDVGFVGPGINTVFGGGMRFRRIREPDGRSRAITGYDWKNVFISHVAMDAVRFDQLIHSYLGHMNINRCVGDGLLFQAGPEGGTTTSVHIDTPYIQNVRRGIVFYTAAYCTLTNPVVEGTSYGYYINRGIGMTLNGMASETIKFGDDGQCGGTTGMFINCYGLTINSPTVYYNTEESAWSKAAMVFIDPVKRVESPTATINGGHIHWSLGPKVPVHATRWNEREGRIYIGVGQDEGYIPPDGATGSKWIGNSYWDDSVQVYITGCTNDPDFNNRFKVTSIKKTPYDDSNDFVAGRAPTPDDGQFTLYLAAFAFGSDLADAVTAQSAVFWKFDEMIIDMSTGLEVGPDDVTEPLQGSEGLLKVYYSIDGLTTSEQDAVNADPFAIFRKVEPFETFWLNTSEGSREGRYVLLGGPEGGAKWVKTEETFEVDFNARDYKVLDKEPEFGDCYAFRLGRNYGVDIATDNIQRVLTTESSGTGQLICKLDISHLHPVRFPVTVNFNPFGDDLIDPYAGSSTTEYVVKAITREAVTFNEVTDDYIVLELIVGNSGEYYYHAYENEALVFEHAPDSIMPAVNGYFDEEGTGDPIEVRFDMNGPKTIIVADLKRVDVNAGTDGNLFLYIKASRYFASGEEFTMYNARFSEMDGTHTINNVSVSNFGGLPCIQVQTTTDLERSSITESVDDAVYVSPKWAAPVSSNVTVDGLDSLFTYDEANAISIQDSRNGQAVANGTQTVVGMAAANNYEFYGHFNNRGGNVWVIDQDHDTVIFGHDSVSNEKFTWYARRKKSPGIEAIYDRN